MTADGQDSSEEAVSTDSDRFTGFGIGLGLTLFAILCVSLLPEYFDAQGGWRVAWSITGGLFGLVGVVGSLIELAKHVELPGMEDLSVVVVFAALAGVLHLAQSNLEGAWSVTVRILVVVSVLIAVVGAGIATARVVDGLATRQRPTRGRRGVALLSAATALIGLVTAILNFVATGSA